jgi:hypothetical protein
MHFKDSDWHSTEGDKRDDLSGNKWFKNSEMLAGNKKFIHNKAEWACERPPPNLGPLARGRARPCRPPVRARAPAAVWVAALRAGVARAGASGPLTFALCPVQGTTT